MGRRVAYRIWPEGKGINAKRWGLDREREREKECMREGERGTGSMACSGMGGRGPSWLVCGLMVMVRWSEVSDRMQ